MEYPNTLPAVFLSRPNRFIARVRLPGGEIETVHVKNTGRCRELLTEGASVILSAPGSQGRKTKYDLVIVYKPGLGLVNLDSQAPNRVVLEWLQGQNCSVIRPEYTYGESRLDFYLEKDGRRILREVKGCTLEQNGIGYFPDAPTVRGTRHLAELAKAAGEGYRAIAAFVIQMPGITRILPNRQTDPDFADALERAEKAGVEILYLPCRVTERTLEIAPGCTL